MSSSTAMQCGQGRYDARCVMSWFIVYIVTNGGVDRARIRGIRHVLVTAAPTAADDWIANTSSLAILRSRDILLRIALPEKTGLGELVRRQDSFNGRDMAWVGHARPAIAICGKIRESRPSIRVSPNRIAPAFSALWKMSQALKRR